MLLTAFLEQDLVSNKFGLIAAFIIDRKSFALMRNSSAPHFGRKLSVIRVINLKFAGHIKTDARIEGVAVSVNQINLIRTHRDPFDVSDHQFERKLLELGSHKGGYTFTPAIRANRIV